MEKGLNRLKVASLCDDDSASQKVQRNKQAGLGELHLENLLSFTLLMHAKRVPSSPSPTTLFSLSVLPFILLG